MSETTKIILELLCSLNQGNTGYSQDRVNLAIQQYNQLVEHEIVGGAKIRL